MRISQCSDTRFVVITRHDQVHLGLRARIFAMASEDDQLIQIRVALDIVGQWCHSQLAHATDDSVCLSRSSHLLDVFAVLESGEEYQQDVQNTHDDQRDVDRLVLGKVSVGEDIVPVHRRGQHEEAPRERREMRREALRLQMIGQ